MTHTTTPRTSFTVGSLFSGIGGIDLGLERAGFEIAWQVEIDEYAQKVLTQHWPHVARYGDIRTVGSHNLASVDLIVGGFPCQPHSVAGKRKASEDDRDLWGEFYRIICEIRPAWVLAENVPGLLSSENGRFFGRILRDLAKSGYDAEWQVLSAAAFGAFHLRERVFLVAYTSSTGLSRSRDTRELSEETRVSPAVFERRSGTWPQRSTWWQSEPSICRVVNGVPRRMDRIKGLGNAVVPQVAEYVGKCIMDAVACEREVA